MCGNIKMLKLINEVKMQVLKSKIFKNGMTKKVKHIMGNTFEIQYSNCNKEDVYKDILKLEKVFECGNLKETASDEVVEITEE